jgi:hypothetical protein
MSWAVRVTKRVRRRECRDALTVLCLLGEGVDNGQEELFLRPSEMAKYFDPKAVRDLFALLQDRSEIGPDRLTTDAEPGGVDVSVPRG